jgi:two-component system chemotaxis response regulator CheB
MPQAARNACAAAVALPLEGIAEHLKGLETE